MSDNNQIMLSGGDALPEPLAPESLETTQDASKVQEGAVDAPKGETGTKFVGIHVVSAGDQWQVKHAGKSDILFENALKKEAIKFATDHARLLKAELFIHGQNGKIQSRNSYGNDPKGRG